jgi:hypothetical protein
MELALWAFIFIVFFAVYKTLRFEKTSRSYHEKELIKRYFEIKNIDADYRYKYLKEWESQARLSFEENKKNSTNNVIKLGDFKVIK